MPGREGWGRRAKQPSQTEEQRKVPKRGLEPRAPPRSSWGATGLGGNGGEAGERSGGRIEALRRSSEDPHRLPLPIHSGRCTPQGCTVLGRGKRRPPARSGSPLPAALRKQKAKPTGSTRGSPSGFLGTRSRAGRGSRTGGSDCATRKVGAGPGGPGATSRACQALSGFRGGGRQAGGTVPGLC